MSNVELDFDFSEQQTEFRTSTRILKLIIATILHSLSHQLACDMHRCTGLHSESAFLLSCVL